MKKDISIFLKIGSFGVIFIIILMIFIIVVGVIAFTNTDFMIGSAQDAYDMTVEDW